MPKELSKFGDSKGQMDLLATLNVIELVLIVLYLVDMVVKLANH